MLKILQPIKIPYPGFSSPFTAGLPGPSTQMTDRQPQSLLPPTFDSVLFLAPNVEGKLPLHSPFAFCLITTLSQPRFLPNPAERSVPQQTVLVPAVWSNQRLNFPYLYNGSRKWSHMIEVSCFPDTVTDQQLNMVS